MTDVCYLPEREQIYWMRDSDILVYDIRADQWSSWRVATGTGDSLGVSLATAAGILWSVGDEPMKFTATNGQDTGATAADIEQTLEIGNIMIGEDGMRWGRVRSLSVLGDFTSEYTLDQSVSLDDETDFAATPLQVNEATVTSWPTSRHTPEWRLPQQKCAALSVTITAAPAVATWTAIALEVQSQGNKAPSRQRQ